MQNSTTKITLRIDFFTKDDGKQKRIKFHYKGTDIIVYRIRLKTITVKAFDSQEANFQFLRTYADRGMGKILRIQNGKKHSHSHFQGTSRSNGRRNVKEKSKLVHKTGFNPLHSGIGSDYQDIFFY